MPQIALPISNSEKPHNPYHLRTITTTSRLILFGLVVVALITISYHRTPAMSASSPLLGWHSRAHPVYEEFTPTSDSFTFASFLNAPVDPEGFNVAFFTPNVVVDARGTVLKLEEQDWQGIANLAARAVTELPETGSFRNQWRIQRDRTSFGIDWLQVKVADQGFKQVAVYGYDSQIDTLNPPVGEYTTLPPVLKELFGVLLEARDGYVKGEEDTVMIAKVKAVADV